MTKVRCPFKGCYYWCCFNGYLRDFLTAFYKHVRADHQDRPWEETRVPGGLVDKTFGGAILATFPWEGEQDG